MPEADRERFVARVRATIAAHAMVAPGDRVVVGVSGGPDSLALLYALHALQGGLGIELHVAHLNHRLRRAAAADAEFVAGAAAGLGIPCTVEAVDVRAAKERTGLSLEHAARRERYALFARVAEAVGAQRIATAHTADDNVETVLLNLLRGAGTDGLGGIPPMRGIADCRLQFADCTGAVAEDGLRITDYGLRIAVVRPLIEMWRVEVEAYCAALGLTPRVDASNRSRAFLRNRVRLDLLPYLERHFGAEVKANLQRLAEIARPEVALLGATAEASLAQVATPVPGGMALSVEGVLGLDLAIRRRVARLALRQVSGSPLEIGFREVERALEALAGQQDVPFDLPGPVRVKRSGDRLLMTAAAETAVPVAFAEAPLTVPGWAPAPGGGRVAADVLTPLAGFQAPWVRRAREVFLDADAVTLPLVVRARRPGDRFTPLGMGGRKSVRKLLAEAEVAADERDQVPVVADAEGILWVAGVAIADRAKVTEHTRRLLHLLWEPSVRPAVLAANERE